MLVSVSRPGAKVSHRGRGESLQPGECEEEGLFLHRIFVLRMQKQIIKNGMLVCIRRMMDDFNTGQ